MSDPRVVAALAAAGLSLAACATGAATPRGSVGGRSGDELLAAGDFDGAAREFRRDVAAGDASADVREKLANAEVRAASAHASAATRAADAGDVDRAAVELRKADDFSPRLPAVRAAHEAVDPVVAAAAQAADLRRRAAAVGASDPQEAQRLLDEAAGVAPGASDDARLRRDATLRAEADRSADRAASAWDAGDRARTARELEAATYGGRPVPKAQILKRKIERDLVAGAAKSDEASLRAAHEFAERASLDAAAVALLRDRLVDRLLASARDLRDTRRPATAALLEVEAKRLRGDVKTPALDQVRDAATTYVLVRPFEDATRGKCDGAALARALRERLDLDATGGGVPLVALDDSPAARSAHPDALVLSGRALDARQDPPSVSREDKTISYRVGSRRTANPTLGATAAKLDAAAAAVRAAQDERDDAAARLKALQFPILVKGDTTPRMSVTELRAAIAAAQTRLDASDAALRHAKDAQSAAQEEAKATPREVDEPVMAEHVLVVTTKTRTAEVKAHVELTLGATTAFSGDVAASATHKETVSDGFAPAGIAPDPDETPDDAAMAALAADQFAGLASGEVRLAAEAGPRRRFDEARAAERSGERDKAAESYSLYLLSTPDVASPERADAARALAELLGVHVALRTGPKRDSP